MVQPHGSKADADSIELRSQGRRVPDHEQLWSEVFFDFMYLGPEEGRRRAEHDQSTKDSFDWAAREAEERRRREEEARQAELEARKAREEALRQQLIRKEEERQQKEQQRRTQQEAAERAQLAKAPRPVDITVRHAIDEMESSITVSVMSN